MGKIFAIGDIHGSFDRLQELMQKIPIDFTEDILVFIGDYIDRGPGSVEVVNYLIGLKKRVPEIIYLKGNHEDMLEKYLDGTDRFTYLLNGGQNTLDSYLSKTNTSNSFPIPPDHMEFFQSLRLYYETEDYIFVHAGLRPKVPLESQEAEDLLWIRDKFIYSRYNFGKPVVFGHTPLEKPLVEPNKIGIDTGAVYGNALTCVQLPSLEFFVA
ncbi:MAG: serine/threonine protein phosphatase [Deltaproteobacteria bacterium]|jgi:serine/threonine protein phosphatase 1|nr:serine/threonine protein phosphatase [Deltaproteobacteria bacterium]